MSKELLLQCECHGYHFFELWHDEDFGVMFTYIERPISLRQRLQAAWKAIKGNDVYDGDLIVRPEDYQKCAEYFAVLAREVGAQRPTHSERDSNAKQ